jgi:prophage regulatory protein
MNSIRLIPRTGGPDSVQGRRGSGRGGRDPGKSQLYDEIEDGLWTPPVKFGKASLWPEHEVDALLAAIIAGATPDERRELVKQLVSQRSACLPRTQNVAPAATASAS